MIAERIEEMRLTDRDDTRVGLLLDHSFGADYAGRSYHQQRPNARLIVRQSARIIGHMAISLRAIRMGEQLAQVAGLAEVATDPSHRGKGIATTLMKAAIAEVKQGTAAFFALFGNQPLYAASGFVSKRNKLKFVPIIDARTGEITETAKQGLMVLPMSDLAWSDGAIIDLVGHAF